MRQRPHDAATNAPHRVHDNDANGHVDDCVDVDVDGHGMANVTASRAL